MGQQQLLLIVLGVIVVGIAVVVGINLFNASSVEANRDGVVSDLNNLGAMAIQFYKKPVSMGGGGRALTLLMAVQVGQYQQLYKYSKWFIYSNCSKRLSYNRWCRN